MYKFRSMVEGADEILEEYLAQNDEAREEYKIKLLEYWHLNRIKLYTIIQSACFEQIKC